MLDLPIDRERRVLQLCEASITRILPITHGLERLLEEVGLGLLPLFAFQGAHLELDDLIRRVRHVYPCSSTAVEPLVDDLRIRITELALREFEAELAEELLECADITRVLANEGVLDEDAQIAVDVREVSPDGDLPVVG